MGGMKWQIWGSNRKRKREGKEENRETGGPNSLPSFPPVLAPFFLLVTPGWAQQVGEFFFCIFLFTSLFILHFLVCVSLFIPFFLVLIISPLTTLTQPSSVWVITLLTHICVYCLIPCGKQNLTDHCLDEKGASFILQISSPLAPYLSSLLPSVRRKGFKCRLRMNESLLINENVSHRCRPTALFMCENVFMTGFICFCVCWLNTCS